MSFKRIQGVMLKNHSQRFLLVLINLTEQLFQRQLVEHF